MSLSVGAVVGGARGDITEAGSEWLRTARRLEDQGFDSLLVPDTLWTPSPFPALAAAGAATTRLRLGTWVVAAPTRTPAALVREVSALQLLSDGRFELGIGAGRPDAEREAAQLGAVWGTAGQRVAAVEAAIEAVRKEVTPVPPVVVAARGPRLLSVAGRLADRVALALPPHAGVAELSAAVGRARTLNPEIGLVLQIMGVGEWLPEWLRRSGLDARELAEAGAVAVLPDDPGQMADRLTELQQRFGITHLTVPGELADVIAAGVARHA